MINVHNLSIDTVHNALLAGDFSVKELVDAYLLEIEKVNTDIHAYVGMYSDIEAQVQRAEGMLTRGESTKLTGIPFAIKDNILVSGEKAGACSKILENYITPYDATVIAKLKAAGAILLGRTNMDEFAMGGSTENSAYGPTKNPIDRSRVAGGSSGGSAAAVAMGGALAALGSDTGGSIRQPASFCGLVGLKPTYGAVSRYGAMAMGSSLDQIGPFGKTVADVEAVFDCIVGKDTNDATSIDIEKDIPAPDKKIGVPFDFVKRKGVNEEVLANFLATLESLKKQGYEVVDVSMPYLHYALSAYYIIMPAEVSSNLARYDGIRYGTSVDAETGIQVYEKSRAQGFGAEVRRRILLGTYILSHGYYDAYYNKALLVREKIKSEFTKAFEEVSYIMTPTSPVPAFTLGEKTKDPLALYLEDIFTVPANIAGVPTISVPSGVTALGLPLGVQCTAKERADYTLFSIAKDIEKYK